MPKLGKSAKSCHKKCTFVRPIKGLLEKSVHVSAEKQFAVQESVKPNVGIVREHYSQTWQNLYPKNATSRTKSSLVLVNEAVK